MVAIELLVDQRPRWKKGTDLLDYQAPIQITVNDKPLPEAYYPGGVQVRLYETAFELLDLAENVMNAVSPVAIAKPSKPSQAEFCYSRTYLVVELGDGGAFLVSLRLDPAIVDDEHLLEGPEHEEVVPPVRLLAELLHFPIAVHDALIEFDPSLEASLETLSRTILDIQERVEKELGGFPDDDGD